MQPRFAILILCPLLALSAWSQTIPIYDPLTGMPFPPLPQMRQFLALTDSQVTAILQNNGAYNAFSLEQQRRIRNAQSQIGVETAKEQLDLVALGTLYAGIENTCRDLRDKAAVTQKRNISVLTDSQQNKLDVLKAALNLIPVISDAVSGNLLASSNPSAFGFIALSSGINLPGCLVLNGDFHQVLSQAQQFLGLANSQVTAILQNDNDYNTLFFNRQLGEIRQAQSQIAAETAEDPLDPTTIGNLYAGIETTCRGLRDKAVTVQQQNVSVLTDGQKVKLNVLNEGLQLVPTVSEAIAVNLLALSNNAPPVTFVGFSSAISTGAFGFVPLSECGPNGVGLIPIYDPLTP